MNIKVRKAKAEDVPFMMALIRELAHFEKQPDEVITSEEQLLREGFGDRPAFYALVAESDNVVTGMSLYYYSYSSWKGRSVYIDDIIVTEKYRGKGIGRSLMEATIEVAREEKAGKVHWQVLDWNEPAIRFYKKYNPSFDHEWINCAISREKLTI